MDNSKSWFKIILVLLLFGMLSMLSFTGYYVYKRYAGVLNQVKQEIKPNDQLLQLERLNAAMLETEGNLQNFYLTGNDSYLNTSYQEEKKITKSIAALKASTDNKPNKQQLILQLEQKTNALISIYHQRFLSPEDDRVNLALQRLKQSIAAQEKAQLSDSTSKKIEEIQPEKTSQEPPLEEEAKEDKKDFLTGFLERRKIPKNNPMVMKQ